MAGYILVVDDEPDVRELFRITLKMAGYRTEGATNGLEAIEAIAKESPALVLLDLMMPRMDGFKVLEKLRKGKRNGDLKVLVATAKTLSEPDQETLNEWPVVGVINKGELDIAQMVSDVKRYIDKPAIVDRRPVPEGSDASKKPSRPLRPSQQEKPDAQKKTDSPAKPSSPPKAATPARPVRPRKSAKPGKPPASVPEKKTGDQNK